MNLEKVNNYMLTFTKVKTLRAHFIREVDLQVFHWPQDDQLIQVIW